MIDLVSRTCYGGPYEVLRASTLSAKVRRNTSGRDGLVTTLKPFDGALRFRGAGYSDRDESVRRTVRSLNSENLTCQTFECFNVTSGCSFNDVLRQRWRITVFVPTGTFQPVADKLLVE